MAVGRWGGVGCRELSRCGFGPLPSPPHRHLVITSALRREKTSDGRRGETAGARSGVAPRAGEESPVGESYVRCAVALRRGYEIRQ